MTSSIVNIFISIIIFYIFKKVVIDSQMKEIVKLRLIAQSYREALKETNKRPDKVALEYAKKKLGNNRLKELDLLWDIDLVREHGKVYDQDSQDDS